MFKLETYAEVVDRALIAERNCNRLSKANDKRGSQIRVIFSRESLVEVHSRSKGCLIQIRRHTRLVQDVERLTVEHVIWSQGRVLNVARLDTSSRIVHI